MIFFGILKTSLVYSLKEVGKIYGNVMQGFVAPDKDRKYRLGIFSMLLRKYFKLFENKNSNNVLTQFFFDTEGSTFVL